MNAAIFLFALFAAVAADKIPGFVVPGKCPVVDEKTLFEQQKPNHPRVSYSIYILIVIIMS